MKSRIIEILATVCVLVTLIGIPIAINYYRPWKSDNGHRIIFLTGVASQGIWTDEKVNGMNYWNTKFRRAIIFLHLGEEVTFRFTSMDVTHTFYVPELGLGPVVVLPGVVNEIKYKATKTGKFTYYCTTFCGECHLFMQGFINVIEGNDYVSAISMLASERDTTAGQCVIHLLKEPENPSSVQRGEFLFRRKGCYSCHGVKGQGGVINPNYAGGTIPTLNDLASKLYLRSKEDADIVIKLLETKTDLIDLEQNPPFRTYSRFHAQYESIIKKIHEGAPVLQKTDSTGFDPPLQMPSWENYLSEDEIHCILIYLISNYNWDE